MSINSKPAHGEVVIENGRLSRQLQSFLDDIEIQLNLKLLGQAVKLPSHTVASLPDAGKYADGLIIVSDAVGGKVTAFSDGSNWLRTTDRTVIS